MDQLFAPWRIEWVERDREDDTAATTGREDDTAAASSREDGGGCVFCDLPERGDDREARIVARSEHAYVLLNNYPYNPGHAMVIPYVHGGDYAALPEDVVLDHARTKQRTLTALEGALDPDAFNAGLNLGGGPSGGSVDDHVHTHVVPRWEGDTNFMPVVADTKVIVEALDDTYDRLRDAFADLDGATVPGPDGAVRLSAD